MARCGERTTVIHRWNNSHTGGHLVVQQPPDFLTQHDGNSLVKRIIRAIVRRVEAARQVSFQCARHCHHLVFIRGDDDQRRIAEDLGLKCFRRLDESLSAHAKKRILARKTGTASRRTAGERFRSVFDECLNPLVQVFLNALAQERSHGCRREFLGRYSNEIF